jgi:hypothetical protein
MKQCGYIEWENKLRTPITKMELLNGALVITSSCSAAYVAKQSSSPIEYPHALNLAGEYAIYGKDEVLYMLGWSDYNSIVFQDENDFVESIISLTITQDKRSIQWMQGANLH